MICFTWGALVGVEEDEAGFMFIAVYVLEHFTYTLAEELDIKPKVVRHKNKQVNFNIFL